MCCVVHVQMELMAAVAVPDEEEIAPLHLPNSVAVVDGQYRAPPSLVVPGVPNVELKDWDAVVNSSQGLNDENKNGEPEGSITTAPDQGPTLEGSRTGPGDDGSARTTKPDDAARVRSVSLVAHQLPSCRIRTQIDVQILFLHGDTFVVSHMSTGHPESGTEEADFRRHRCLCVRVKRECESAGAQCAHAAGTMLVTDVNCGLKSALGCAVVCLRGP